MNAIAERAELTCIYTKKELEDLNHFVRQARKSISDRESFEFNCCLLSLKIEFLNSRARREMQ